MSRDDERLARIALTHCREPGDLWLARAVAAAGATELVAHLRRPRTHQGIAAKVSARLAEIDPLAVLDRAERLGLRFVIPGDDEWSTRLGDLEHSEPNGAMGGPPVGLWLKGPLRLSDLDRSVAIVGSRSATTYGAEVASVLAAELTAGGWTVVSGAAFGIDVAAHRGALGAGGPTVAVLACGADRVYPSEHRPLIERLGETGLVVSETLPGGAPFKARFLSRNRIIAAMTRGTVVVEAALRSGALNTSTWATTINRPVLVVPGPITSAVSEGVHELVRTGQAGLVARGSHVIEALAEIGEEPAPVPRGPSRPEDGLTGLQRRVLEATPARAPAPEGSIARLAGVDPGVVRTTLGELAEVGLTKSQGQGWRLARRPAAGAAAP